MKTILCFLALSILGWIPLFMGLHRSRVTRRKNASETARAEGIITGYETKQKPGGRGRMFTAYYPIVSFTVDSREFTGVSEQYFVDPLLENEKEKPMVGSTIALFYDPNNPASFHLDTNQDDKGLIRIGLYIIGFAAAVSVVCTVAGVF